MEDLIERATIPDIRKSCEIAELFKKAHIRFMPMPVFNNDDFKALEAEMRQRLDKIEKFYVSKLLS